MSEQSRDGPPSKWGKGKTDPDTWWKKGGPSPNSKGRPKGSKNQKTLWKEAHQKKISVTIDGTTQVMTKQECTYEQVSTQAASGNPKFVPLALALDEKFDPGETVAPTPDESAADFATLDHWIELREKFKVFEHKEQPHG